MRCINTLNIKSKMIPNRVFLKSTCILTRKKTCINNEAMIKLPGSFLFQSWMRKKVQVNSPNQTIIIINIAEYIRCMHFLCSWVANQRRQW